MSTVHPNDAYLMAYANGTLSDGMNVLIASHLTYCPICREKVAQYEALQGGLLETSVSDDVRVDASLDMIFDRMASAPIEVERPVAKTNVPSPIAAHIDGELEDLPWRFRLPGLYDYPLPQFEGEDVCLLKAKPGTGMLSHTHEEDEATLILTGVMEDGDTLLRAGDVAIAGPEHDHHPKIVGDEICYCLVVMSGRLKFTGPVGRALNLFT
ncbi:MAG: ChrR family anti-sigma-E factor [Pseudomonadota bacterium]